jgi:hypothetical protein
MKTESIRQHYAMDVKPITATEIMEANRLYWSPGGQGWLHAQRAKEIFEKLNEILFLKVQDIIAGRTRDGWPTRDAAAFGEDE